MRTDTWRYTAWVPLGANGTRVDWGASGVHHELYNLSADGVGGTPLDFDYDGYSVNLAAGEPGLIEDIFFPRLQAAVASWY